VTNQVFERFQLESKFVHLENNGNLISLLIDEKFWSEGSSQSYFQSGRLMGVLNIDPGPSHWEVHPDGDELLYLLSGSMDVVIELEGKNKVITLVSLSSCIVPQETWHQTIAREPCSLLFITPVKGTQHHE
jgi:mannose-6-phosphate isomerase-like protein (cupin superfamily)